MRASAIAIIPLLVVALAGCNRVRKPDLPGGVIVKPQVVTVTREVYVREKKRVTEAANVTPAS